MLVNKRNLFIYSINKKRDLFFPTVKQYTSLERKYEELKEKFSEESIKCKDLYNKLIELRLTVYSYTMLHH